MTGARSTRNLAEIPQLGQSRIIEPPSLISLGRECVRTIINLITQLGLCESDVPKMIDLALIGNRAARPSATRLAYYSQVAAMLQMWRRDQRYIRSGGTPRVLKIYGKGPTLETLVRKFMRGVPMEDVLNFICLHCEVTRSSKNTVALVGSPVLIYERKPEVVLAAFAERLRYMCENAVHNFNLPPTSKSSGLFERMVRGSLSDKAFKQFSRDIRQQLQDLCDQVDTAVDNRHQGEDKGDDELLCGMCLYLFSDKTIPQGHRRRIKKRRQKQSRPKAMGHGV